jgi:hypothetical protein
MKTAFLLMPFHRSYDWLHAEVVNAAKSAGVRVKRSDGIFRAGVVVEQIIEALKSSDAVVAVCTNKNANVFFELGLAISEGHRPILLARSTRDLPFDIQHFRAQMYGGSGPADSRASLGRRIKAALEETLAERIVIDAQRDRDSLNLELGRFQ